VALSNTYNPIRRPVWRVQPWSFNPRSRVRRWVRQTLRPGCRPARTMWCRAKGACLALQSPRIIVALPEMPISGLLHASGLRILMPARRSGSHIATDNCSNLIKIGTPGIVFGIPG